MDIEAGKIYRLRVLRRTDIGYMLSYNDDEIFLHQNQTPYDLDNDSFVDVFIYYDNKRRLAATMEKPLITLGEKKWLEVTDLSEDLGAFVNVNIAKDILISKDFLPYDHALWPIKGDMIYVELKEKKNQLILKPVNKFDLSGNPMPLNKGDKVNGHVMKIFDEGITIYTLDLSVIFVHRTQYRGIKRLGEEVCATILSVNGGYEYSATLNPQKEDLIDKDGEVIIEYLKNHFGKMTFSSNSSKEEIELVFKMSKKAFKRALGHLYKERKIEIKEDEVFLL